MRQVIRVWIVGDWEHAEFVPAVAYLQGRSDLKICWTARRSELVGVEGEPAPGKDPGLILLVASRPGRFSAAEVESLHRRAPLARLVALLGSWCEGEVRSGHPWPGVSRIYAHQWQSRLPRELQAWPPRTATEFDRLLVSQTVIGSQRQLIGIAAAQRTTFEAVSAACRSVGSDAVWLWPQNCPPVNRVDAILYDATLELPGELTRLTQLRAQLRSAPAVLLLDFPRPGDLELAYLSGVSGVLAKPYLVADLAAQLERAMAPVLLQTAAA